MVRPDGADGEWLDLADAITLLRDQIAAARARIAEPQGSGNKADPLASGDKGVLFELGEITVELGLELARTAGVDGGLHFAVMGVGVGIGGKREKTESATHKLVVRLTPQTSGGKPVLTHDVD